MKNTKSFDCVEMKRKGAEKMRKALRGKTAKQQLAYWKKRTEALKKRKNAMVKT